jgi:hypothetical protein
LGALKDLKDTKDLKDRKDRLGFGIVILALYVVWVLLVVFELGVKSEAQFVEKRRVI